MRIGGIQKLTLLDYPGKIACTVFLAGCNLRCPYCHNASLAKGEAFGMAEEELFEFLAARRKKLDGVCISGGEPTLWPQLPDFLCRIKELGFSVKLDTNGTNPKLMSALCRDGLLDYVAMDIKASPDKYREVCGGADVISSVRSSAQLLLSGAVDYEFRTTLCEPLFDLCDADEIGRWLAGAKRYYLQQFVPSGDILSPSGLYAPSEEKMAEYRQRVIPYIPNTYIRGI